MRTPRTGRTLAAGMALMLAVLTAGCGGSSTTEERATATTTTTTDGTPTIEQAREAGAIAREIESEPNRAAEILAAHGMTAESLESLLYQIAKDPGLSEAYEQAKGGATPG